MADLPPHDGHHNDSDRELRALTQLFDAAAPSDRAEAEEELLNAGVDPQRVGERLDLLARRALGGLSSAPPTGAGARPAHARIRPLHLWATAAVALLVLAGLRLLRGGTPETSGPQEADNHVVGKQTTNERPALRLNPLGDLDDKGSGAGQRAGHGSKGQPESVRPSRDRNGRDTAAREDARSGAAPSDVAPSVERLLGAATEDLVATVTETARRFHDTTQQLQMTVDQAGAKQVTRFQLQTKIFNDGAFKAVVHFEPPFDKEVTALLLEWAADQPSNTTSILPLNAWAFIANLKRVRRLTYGGCTLTPDLTCLDLLLPGEFLPWAVSNWNARSVEQARGALVTIDLVPAPERSLALLPDYQRLRVRLQAADATVREVEFFDQRDVLMKTLLLTNFQRIDGVPIAHRLEMVTLPTASGTVLEVVGFRHDQNLSDDLFTIRRMIDEWH